MTSNSTVSCPLCNKDNSPNMAFCIFCGADLKQAKSGQRSALGASEAGAVPGAEAAPPDVELRVCPKCNSADPLNSAFCIICGTKIPARERSKGVTSSVLVQSELESLKKDISTVQPAGSAAVKPLQLPSFLLYSILILAGLGLGALAGSTQLKPADNIRSPALPTRGLALLTARPFADFVVDSPDNTGKPAHRTFLFGRTGQGGDASLDLPPGEYTVHLADASGNDVSMAATVEETAPAILGGPPGPKLLASPSAAVGPK